MKLGKKLGLDKETITQLDEEQLAHVAGGARTDNCTDLHTASCTVGILM